MTAPGSLASPSTPTASLARSPLGRHLSRRSRHGPRPTLTEPAPAIEALAHWPAMTFFPIPLPRPSGSARTVGRSQQPWILMGIVSALMFGGLAHRLVQLQLLKGTEFSDKADRNRVQSIAKPPSRGSIFDREGRILAGSELTHSVAVWRTATTDEAWPQLRRNLATILEIPEAEIQEKVDTVTYESRFLVTIDPAVSPDRVTQLMEGTGSSSGLNISLQSRRHYPHGELAAHLLGYTGEISKEEFEGDRFREHRSTKGYRYGDFVGKMGLEKTMEFQLRGVPGRDRLEIDGKGNVRQILDGRAPEAGTDLTLTLDLDLQQAAEKALGDRNGAIVAMDPRNGEILALVSRPAFDPNLFSRRIDNASWQALQRKRHPFVNRAVQAYPPASTFKVVTAVAAMESGALPPTAVLQTRPFLQVGPTKIWDWNRSGFGPMNFVSSMAWSSNTFYGQAGQKAGPEALLGWARKFGFGERTGIELESEESSGLIPTPDLRGDQRGMPWSRVDTINSSIGQGYIQASPVQIAVMFSVFANGGKRVHPHLVRRGAASPVPEPVSLNLKPSTIDVVRRGLRSVVTTGTGGALSGGLPPVAGKSGTAEDPPRETHAWFGAFAPYDAPEITVVGFLENGGGGGGVAGPAIRPVFEAYFAKQARLKAARAGKAPQAQAQAAGQ